ncbi:DMT family transporter [Pseudoduganella armeniaca]|uniref:EamA family transporter n=1 Tax=Pseudoduganella armeniaca TaxID=2072590 RepID=A0A2R4CF21_9BURK|nr:DMT family transporter [Pseudoduganella armeniaca]AVR98205.1 EamA family transporter [Pseudoduganella armeniaca]
MSTANLLRLFLLAAIWGGSFLFMRIAAPVLGPGWLIELRVVFAALFLAAIALVLKKSLHLRKYWKHFLILGLFNAAIPFVLFAYAAKTLSASLLSVLNATAPMWAALIAAVWQRHMVSPRVLLGLVLGTLGVALLVGMDRLSTQDGALLAIGAALLAPFNYGIATVYAKSAPAVEPFSNAHGSMWAGALLTLPSLLMFPQPAQPSPGILAAALALGVLCSGVAYLLYYGLVRDVGPTSALTVTFLSPLFGILWGVLFLQEHVGWYTLAGAAIVIAGVVLVTGYRPAWARAEAAT